MARQPQAPRSNRDVTPGEMPQVTPSQYQPHTHDFTLQAVIEMQRSIGDLCAKVDRLISDVDSQGKKIDAVRLRMAWVGGIAATLGAIGALLFAAIKAIPWSSLGH